MSLGVELELELELARTLEALLFLSAEPVGVEALADACEAEPEAILDALVAMRDAFEADRRGLVLRELAGGWALSSHPDAEPAARRLLARPRTPPMVTPDEELTFVAGT